MPYFNKSPEGGGHSSIFVDSCMLTVSVLKAMQACNYAPDCTLSHPAMTVLIKITSSLEGRHWLQARNLSPFLLEIPIQSQAHRMKTSAVNDCTSPPPPIKQKPRKREDEREWLVCVDRFLKRCCYFGTGVPCELGSSWKQGAKSFEGPTKEKQLLVKLFLCPAMKVAWEWSFSLCWDKRYIIDFMRDISVFSTMTSSLGCRVTQKELVIDAC